MQQLRYLLIILTFSRIVNPIYSFQRTFQRKNHKKPELLLGKCRKKRKKIGYKNRGCNHNLFSVPFRSFTSIGLLSYKLQEANIHPQETMKQKIQSHQ